ncbi:hypothetical protein [Paenibacillus sp. UNC451MF]|uniref:hypothetical protein n=1 Tax=Paenibacillus sp. UNC451MF TaxID=1449063 RepID=UPI00048D6AF9|nr:hypothetical protein [Paenibacillus sp. UNC451MF]
MFMKKIAAISIAGSLLLSCGIASAADQSGTEAVSPSADSIQKGDHAKKKLTAEERKQKVLEAANKLGINTEGKTDKELRELVRQQLEEAAKQKQADKLKKLQDETVKLGIELGQKSAKELSTEVREKQKQIHEQKKQALLQKLQDEAVKLGVDPADKTAKELGQAIKAKHKELAAQKHNGKKKKAAEQ